MKFKEYIELSETMTDTSCIAGFSRRVGEIVTREWPNNGKDKKKPYRQPQVEN